MLVDCASVANCGVDPAIYSFDADLHVVIVVVILANPVGDLFRGPILSQLLLYICHKGLVLLSLEMSRLLAP